MAKKPVSLKKVFSPKKAQAAPKPEQAVALQQTAKLDAVQTRAAVPEVSAHEQKPAAQSKSDELTISILSEKIDLLKSEVSENKLYLELCFIALLVLVFGYFKSDIGHQAITQGTLFGKLMIAITIGLYLGVVYFFYSIIRFNHKNRMLIKEKLDNIVQK